jgi:DNA modification methylase
MFIKGDCRTEMALMVTLEARVDMVFTDPDYAISNDRNSSGASKEFSGYTSNKGAWDVYVPAKEWVPLACELLKPGGIFACYGTFGSLVPIYHCLESPVCGMQFQSHITWHKTNPAPSIHRRMLTHANEIILVYSKGSHWTFNYDYAKSINNGKQLHNHFDCPAVRRVGGVTRKPPVLCEKIIRLFTDEGDTVLDPFTGSGAIIEAAEAAGRVGIGIEIDPDRFDYEYITTKSKLAELVEVE